MVFLKNKRLCAYFGCKHQELLLMKKETRTFDFTFAIKISMYNVLIICNKIFLLPMCSFTVQGQ